MTRFNTVVCPNCGEALSVSENAPPTVTCPKCLVQVENPSTAAPSNMPTPVVSPGDQARRDGVTGRIVGLTLIITLAFVVAAEVLAASYPSSTRGRMSVVIAMVTIAFGMAAYVLLARPRSRDVDDTAEVARQELLDRPTAPGAVPTLEYRTASTKSPLNTERVNVGAALLGFLLGIGACAAGVLVLAFTVGSTASPIYMAIVFVAVMIVGGIGANVGQRRGFKGFRPAVIVGLVLGMMALGPAGFCYMTAIR